MKSHIKKQVKTLSQRLKELSVLGHDAAEALGVSDGEFWVCYGRPFLLQSNPRK